MKKISNSKSQGFTIIEVLIVLAIAGLIMLVVFLAVPALQRNSRNTISKNDAQNVLGGVSEYEGANNGSLPTGVAGTGTIDYTGAAGTNKTSIKVQGTTIVNTAATPPATATVGTITVVLKAQCNGDTAITANNRSIAVFYPIEISSGPVLKCSES